MEVLVFLVPLAITLGAIGLAGFLWALKNGQYEDLDGAAWRAIMDDEPGEAASIGPAPPPAASQGKSQLV
jgi:cbb3-type cytochrome oxidase maturation protein